MMVAPGDERRARGRAQRCGMELSVAQPGLRDTVQGRRRDDAAERARHAEAGIIGHDEQDIGRVFGRDDGGAATTVWNPPPSA